MELLIVLVLGIGIGYLLLLFPYLEVLRHNAELRGRENFRIGYRPPEQIKTSPEASKEQRKPSENVDLAKMQEEAMNDETVEKGWGL